MLCLAIHIYENSTKQPNTSIRIPLAVVSTIAKLVPASVIQKLNQNGIDVNQLIHEATTKLEPCILVDITDHDDHVVIAIEHMQVNQPLQLTARG